MRRIGAIIVGLAALGSIVGPALVPYDPTAQALALRLQPPSFAHPFGLDELGRDILSRLVLGARVSFFVGLSVVSVSAALGTLVGAIAGYFRGRVDDVISRVMDVLLAFPGILLIAVTYVAMNLITDHVYGWLDPPLRYE